MPAIRDAIGPILRFKVDRLGAHRNEIGASAHIGGQFDAENIGARGRRLVVHGGSAAMRYPQPDVSRTKRR